MRQGPPAAALRRQVLRQWGAGLLGTGLCGAARMGASTWPVAGGLGAAALLGGCGFQLRADRPLAIRRLALTGVQAGSSMGLELRRQLGQRLTLVESPAQAQAVLSVEQAARERQVTGLTSTGLVRELLLRLRFRFRLVTPQGRVLLEPPELRLQRDMSTSEGAALAKAREEDEIFRVMERDVVQQVIRMLEALSPSVLDEAPKA